MATDVDGDNLVYKLYVDGNLNATSTSTAYGTAVSFSVTGLGEYTTHSYYVTATDGSETSTSSIGSVRTYCSATGYTCTPYTCYASDCIYCENGYEVCDGNSFTQMNVSSSYGRDCESCGEFMEYLANQFTCKTCGNCVCTTCYATDHYGNDNCKYCGGLGEKCSHGIGYDHLTCSHFTSPSGSHSYCSHGYTSQHD